MGSTRRGLGSAARGASQESEQMVGGCVPLPLAGQLKIVTGRKSSWRGWEHLPCDRQRLAQQSVSSRQRSRAGLGCNTPHPRQHPSNPTMSACSGALHGRQPSALRLVLALGGCRQREHLGPCWHPWQAPGRVAGPAAAAGARASSTGCGAGGRLARPPCSPQRRPFLRGRIGSE